MSCLSIGQAVSVGLPMFVSTPSQAPSAVLSPIRPGHDVLPTGGIPGRRPVTYAVSGLASWADVGVPHWSQSP
ncbi:hypothetical protein J6590_033707 [Homalodisca vitripennis]|nr:hypothetical protein J6590_033707 [Homalodisca vitripennis]